MYGYSHEEIAEEIGVSGASTLQIQRSERIYDMFSDGDYEDGGLSYSAIAELQRIFPQTDDARSAYDCIVATGHPLRVDETRAWVELLMAGREVTRESVRESSDSTENLARVEFKRAFVESSTFTTNTNRATRVAQLELSTLSPTNLETIIYGLNPPSTQALFVFPIYTSECGQLS